MDNRHIGSKSELEAQLWFLDKGYEVFGNVSSCGPIDIAILEIITGKITLIDVKTQKIINGRWKQISLKDQQKKLGVRICYRLPDGSFSFELPEINDYWMKFSVDQKKYIYKKSEDKNNIERPTIMKKGKLIDCPDHLLTKYRL